MANPAPPPAPRIIGRASDMQSFAPKVTVRKAASFLGLSKSTLDKLRLTGGGPTYIRLGRRVVYDLGDLEAWADRGRRSNTSASR